MKIGINDRLTIEGDVCTVLYVGSIPNWPTNTAYGVEWDNEKRGRHDGMIEGVRYFTTRKPRAGSFLKDLKIQEGSDSRISFEQALKNKYGDDSIENISIKFGEKKTESYGFSKLNKKNSDLLGIKTVSLSKCDVYCAELFSGSLTSVFGQEQTSLMNLDLSYNLFTDLNEITTIIERFSSLRCLNLSGNRFSELKLRRTRLEFTQIKELSLSCCNLSKNDLAGVLELFPRLEVLDVSSNELDDIPDLPTGLKELSIADNRFQYIPKILSHCSLISLDVSNNEITALPVNTRFSTLKSVILAGNKLQTWNDVDKINNIFPKVEDLWLKHNTFRKNDDQEYFYEVIARVRSLIYLDAMPIGKTIRKEAELYFISMVLSSKIEFKLDSPRWREFMNKYQIKCSRTNEKEPNFLESQLFLLPVMYAGQEYHIKILTSFTVRYLRTILSEKFGMDNIIMRYSIIDGIKNEFTHEFSTLASFNIKDSVIYVCS